MNTIGAMTNRWVISGPQNGSLSLAVYTATQYEEAGAEESKMLASEKPTSGDNWTKLITEAAIATNTTLLSRKFVGSDA